MNESRRRLFALGLMVGGGLMVVGVALALFLIQSTPQPKLPRVGSRLADFQLTDLSGKSVRLSDYAGKNVLINAWATWCPPCRDEMPMLVDYYNQHLADGFVILAVNDGDRVQDVTAFAQKYGMNFPVLLDTDSRLVDSLMIDSLPTSILIGRDGTVKALHVGGMDEPTFKAEILARLE